jgi:hypothetical protein
MKKIFLTVIAVGLASMLSAQSEVAGVKLSHYLFPGFVEGTVKQKSGEINRAQLNYNLLTEEMIFEQAGQQMALDKTENIDTVYLSDKKFIPVGNVFYEVATNTPIALFIQHKSKIIPPGNETGLGSSQTSAITNVADLKSAGLAYRLKLPDDYKLMSQSVYWIRKGENFMSIKNLKEVQNFFPAKADAIKSFAKENKISFKNPEDVTKLIVFCNS